MTQKDLRLKYHMEEREDPFNEKFQLYIFSENSDKIERYIEWLEEEVIQSKKDKSKN